MEFMICQAIYGNGARTGMMRTIIKAVRTGIRRGLLRGNTVFFAVGRGTAIRATGGRRPASGTVPTSGTTSASIVRGLLNPLLFFLLPFVGGVQGAKPPGGAPWRSLGVRDSAGRYYSCVFSTHLDPCGSRCATPEALP